MEQQVVSQSNTYQFNGYLYDIQNIFHYRFYEITIEEANQLVGSLKSLYTGLILQGYYLPKYESACINSQYLLRVACKKVFICKQAEIKVAYLVKQASKIDLYRELFQIIGQEVELGFTSDKLPDRQWLINIFYNVSPNHLYFKQPSSKLIHGLTQSDIQKPKNQIQHLLDLKDQDSLNLNRIRKYKDKQTKLKQKLQRLKHKWKRR